MSKDWLHSIKSKVFEDEIKDEPEHPTTPSPVISIPTPSADLRTAGTDDIYKALYAKTDFSTTKSGAVLAAKTEIIKDLPLDERTKLQTAIKIGSAEGLSAQSILDDLGIIKATLNNEKNLFDAAVNTRLEKEVTGRQNKLNEISKQISDLQNQQTQITQEMFDQQSKIQRGQQQFISALNSRTIEIDTMISKYTALLKG